LVISYRGLATIELPLATFELRRRVAVVVVCQLQEAPLIRDFGHTHGGWGHRSIIPPK